MHICSHELNEPAPENNIFLLFSVSPIHFQWLAFFLTVNTTSIANLCHFVQNKSFSKQTSLKWTRVINNAMFFSKIIKKTQCFFY